MREEANAIWTVYQRADFLPEAEQQYAKNEIHRYLNLHLSVPFAEEENLPETKKRYVPFYLKHGPFNLSFGKAS